MWAQRWNSQYVCNIYHSEFRFQAIFQSMNLHVSGTRSSGIQISYTRSPTRVPA